MEVWGELKEGKERKVDMIIIHCINVPNLQKMKKQQLKILKSIDLFCLGSKREQTGVLQADRRIVLRAKLLFFADSYS